MTGVLRPLPFDDWPAIDRQLWNRARRPARRLDAPGWASNWRPATAEMVLIGYGCWLAWLSDTQQLDAEASPVERIDTERALAFADHLDAHLAGATVDITIRGLHRAVWAMEETTRFRWLDRLARHYANKSPPMRNKAARVVPSSELFEYGVELMQGALTRDRAPIHGALQYRNGLLLAFMAAHPERRRNIVDLQIEHTLFRGPTRYRFRFEAAATKTRRVRALSVTDRLTSPLDAYLNDIRPILVSRSRTEDRGYLWLAMDGIQLCGNAITNIVSNLTEDRFGRRVSPHLFRDCANTSVAIEDPQHIGIAMSVLGHTNLRTGEKHYNMATSLTASRRFTNGVSTLRQRLLGASEADRKDLDN